MTKPHAIRTPLAAALAYALAFSTVARSQEEPVQAVRRYPGGFLCLPYLGLNQPVGDSARYFPGLRAGGLFGYNVRGLVSLNAELTIDVLKRQAPTDVDYRPSEGIVNFAFSPLIHMEVSALRLVVGPQLGYFRYTEARVEPGDWTYDDRNFHGDGWSYGINLGVFYPLNKVALGALVNYAGHRFRTRCEKDYRTNEVDVCQPPNRPDRHALGLAGALLF